MWTALRDVVESYKRCSYAKVCAQGEYNKGEIDRSILVFTKQQYELAAIALAEQVVKLYDAENDGEEGDDELGF